MDVFGIYSDTSHEVRTVASMLYVAAVTADPDSMATPDERAALPDTLKTLAARLDKLAESL